MNASNTILGQRITSVLLGTKKIPIDGTLVLILLMSVAHLKAEKEEEVTIFLHLNMPITRCQSQKQNIIVCLQGSLSLLVQVD